MSAESPNETRLRNRPDGHTWLRRVCLWLVVAALLAVLIWRAAQWSSAFGSAERLTNTLLWPWLELLLVPAALIIGAYVLDSFQKRRDAKAEEAQRKREKEEAVTRERRQAEEQRRQKWQEKTASEERLRIEQLITAERHDQTTLEAYFDFMSHYIVRRRHSEVQLALLRARTLLVLDSLVDSERRAKVYAFAKETGLLSTRLKLFHEYKGVGLQKRDFARADLTGAYFGGCDLSYAILKEATLRESFLPRANLTGANLARALLDEVKNETNEVLQNAANAPDVILDGAVLKNAKLTRAELPRAKLRRANLKGAVLEGANLTDADLTGAYLEGAWLNGAVLDGASLHGCHLDPHTQMNTKWLLVWRIVNDEMEGVDLPEEADFSSANLRGANISAFHLSKAILRNAKLDGLKAHDTDLRGADLRNASCSDAAFVRADLSGADLRGTNLSNADLSWCNLWATRLDEYTQIARTWEMVWQIINQQLYPSQGQAAQRDTVPAGNPWEVWVEIDGNKWRGLNLEGASLEKAYLVEAKLNQVRLSKADLTQAYLNKADLRGAQLRGASLVGADLSDACLDNADLSFADLTDAIVLRRQLIHTTTNGIVLPGNYSDGESPRVSS